MHEVKPWVGPESTDGHRGLCAYSPNPGDPQCETPAAVHLMVDTGRYGVVALQSCVAHAGIARSSADVLMEHPYEGACWFPNSLWNQAANVCVIDDSGQERAEIRRELVNALAGLGPNDLPRRRR